MFLRIDKLGVELPPSKYDPTAAAAVQELMGGRFGEMSTLNNYLHQSTSMRAKKQLGPFYELVASITAEEVGHVEVVAEPSTHCSTRRPTPRTPTKRRSRTTRRRASTLTSSWVDRVTSSPIQAVYPGAETTCSTPVTW